MVFLSVASSELQVGKYELGWGFVDYCSIFSHFINKIKKFVGGYGVIYFSYPEIPLLRETAAEARAFYRCQDV